MTGAKAVHEKLRHGRLVREFVELHEVSYSTGLRNEDIRNDRPGRGYVEGPHGILGI